MGKAGLMLPDGSEHRLEGQISLGRDDVCDVQLGHKTVSRRHALIFQRGDRWWIADTGSFNGTFLNDDRVAPGVALQLHHADRIRLGAAALVFSDPTSLEDEESTDELDVAADASDGRLSPLQRQVVGFLCEAWLGGSTLDELPTNDQIAARLGTPEAVDTVKGALRRSYAKAGLSTEPAHTKRRALCRVARQRGWI